MKRVLLIVSGGIAAYKALDVVRLLRAHAVVVTPVLTATAKAFVTPLSLETLTGRPVYDALLAPTQESEIGHIQLARQTDLVLVCPATAHIMARLAHGLADDLPTTLLLATTAPILLAPAMNVQMWQHPATQANHAILTRRGVRCIGPDEGAMACGEWGAGRLSPPEIIRDAVLNALFPSGPLKGRHVLVTAGPTRERLDPVRFLSNYSSGKQGFAIATATAALGAHVTLVTGPVALPTPEGVTRVDVESAEDMLAACERSLPVDVIICTAAVSDWRARTPATGKIKKNHRPPTLELMENPDILARMAQNTRRPPLVIGFAAETDDVLANAQAKYHRKHCDWMLANDVRSGVFGADDNCVTVLDAQGTEPWPPMTKQALADRLAARIAAFFSFSSPE